jgi:DNA repair photolyase
VKKVKGYVERKSMLYKTDVEYGDYTMNHVVGCAHGCKYPCYAMLQKLRFGIVKNYDEWIKPFLVSNTLELLDKEIPRLKKHIKSVHLCFTTDPFMYEYDEICDMSMAALRKLNAAGIKCTVLTKGILPKELAKLSKNNEYGITLISLDERYRKKVEPGSASYKNRIASLKYLHDKGFRTWVSIEPYPTPNLIEQDLDEILEKLSFADKIIFGRTNYNSEVSAFKPHREFYNEQADKVIKFCKKHKKDYHIKNGTITN